MAGQVFLIKEHVVPCQHIREYARATSNEQEEVLKLAVKQYIPLDNTSPQPGDVTIIGAHANGFPKELYEPLWEDLHARSKTCGFRIRGIWIADMSNQGRSERLNENVIGDDPSWADHPRDLLHMINVFRSEMPLPIVAVGHSLGGCELVNLSLMHPRLFTTMVLLDPVLQRHSYAREDRGETGQTPARLSSFRRDLWPSRAVAAAGFQKSKFYQSWDKRVLDRWIEFGLRETPSAIYPDEKGSVTLATSKHQEVFTFLRPLFHPGVRTDLSNRSLYPDFDKEFPPTVLPFYRPEPPLVFVRLPHLRPTVLYIFGGTSEMSTPDLQKDKLDMTGVGIGGSGGVKEGKVDKVVLEGVGHLVAMEAADKCADAASQWIGKELRLWSAEEKKYREWTKNTTLQKITMSEEWKEKIGGPFRKPAKGKL